MPDTSSEAAAKLADFHSNPSYEHRIVVFYDILGWRNEILRAGSDPAMIGELRRTILYHHRLLGIEGEQPLSATTFSDNVVISVPVAGNAHIQGFLQRIAAMPLMTLALGRLLRGGIAVGDILHDKEVVFGPALNRAYELESRVADVPRIVVDDAVLEIASIEQVVRDEEGVAFMDPFTPGFLKLWLEGGGGPNPKHLSAGLPSAGRSLRNVPGDIGLRGMLDRLKPMLKVPLEDKEWRKVAWLYDRIASRLGVPLASSYPRTRPANAS